MNGKKWMMNKWVMNKWMINECWMKGDLMNDVKRKGFLRRNLICSCLLSNQRCSMVRGNTPADISLSVFHANKLIYTKYMSIYVWLSFICTSLNLWPHTWSTLSLNKETNSYNKTHSFLFTLFRSKEPCSLFHHRELKVDGDPGSAFFTFSAAWVFFPFFIAMADGSESNDSFHHVTIKVPTFYKHAPDTWFVHLEAQFALRKITTSSTKMY